MKKMMLCLTALSFSLTACFPVVLIGAGATAAGTSLARDSRSLQTISDDSTIQYQANQKITNSPALEKGCNITVTSFNHIVLLTGQVPSQALKAKAEALVQSVPKVRRVYNQIQVASEVGMIQTADDATISANVKARMMVTSDLNTNNFKYVVENKTVYLMGYASTEQTQLALNTIRNSSGVERVVNLVENKNDSNDAVKTTSEKMEAPAETSSGEEASPGFVKDHATVAESATKKAPLPNASTESTS